MSVRAKFQCSKVEKAPVAGVDTYTYNITMNAVADGSDENKEFFKWTPQGQLTLATVNPAAGQQFIEGHSYYLDFTDATSDEHERRRVG